ncbi:tRNA(1)(Val) (adenine(37)-N(6))-methyltransferase TrmN [Xenorhabdus innexi]|uniref:tRNA1(Val) (adenine(37)-N6)-methyltransferase n=1 Tax=Xenorhabdus innexi TaxID=290109 RepID=A0A1N6MV88_9GAMM|nr:tRNA1(Val) (adenine(37)-N6)-methyltransferase [Xenorhabdus innexi]PHM38241.1 tRNA --methyltransferase [Xenorhabdus innexi]SIP72778.1 tRNA (adenine-N(6)-)-methyltransferase [Xenorhabdus innexi]
MTLIHKPALRRGGFTFKQFFVGHDKCAMKVGTDGVLLGAWAPVANRQNCLDIGCGSGLIALMIAQRAGTDTIIDAVELDNDAAMQAIENIKQSPWSDRIRVCQQDIHHFAMRSERRYDLIVSNPPYFEPAIACRNEARNQARYTEALTHQGLLNCVERLITPEGLFCVVLPYQIGEAFEKMATECGWFTHYRLNIRDRLDKPLHRLLLGLSRQKQEMRVSELIIRAADGVYSKEFQQLVKDFYLYY